MASTTNPTAISSLSLSSPESSEIAKLKVQNAKLAKLVETLRSKHGAHSVQPLSQASAKQAENFYSQLQRKIDQQETTPRSSPSHRTEIKHDGDEGKKAERLPTRNSPFFASGITDKPSKSAIFICKNGPLNTHEDEDEDEEFELEDKAYVCVMDVPDEEWWEIIEPEVEDVQPIAVEPAFDSDRSYEIIDDEEVTQALTAFVTSTITSHPETFSLSDVEMKQMLEGTFATLQDKTMTGKVLEYGTLAYSAYGWGSYAWQIYSKPGMAKFVLKGCYTAGSWIIYLCL